MKTFIEDGRAKRIVRWSTLLLLIGQGCATRADDASESTAESAEAIKGPTSFVSAEPLFGVYGEEEEEEEEEAEEAMAGASSQKGAASVVASPALEQGDIFEVLGDGHVLNLNAWRGLQVIDVHDPEDPRIVGRLPLAGKPLQMHVKGNRAFVVMGGDYHYQSDPKRIAAADSASAAVLSIDISIRKHPKVLSRTAMTGSIKASRFESGLSGDALYVGTSEYNAFPVPGTGYYEWRNQTLVRRFGVTGNGLTLTSTAEIRGDLRGLEQRDGALVVLHSANKGNELTTRVSIVDIGAGGVLSVRGKVTALANIPSEAHIDLRGKKLRVFSGPKFDSPMASGHLQTWDMHKLI